jgi:hypothetical protein
MRTRSLIVCSLALAALAGAVLSGFAFAPIGSPDQPVAWLFNIAACILVFVLGFAIRGGTISVALLVTLLALCLPAVGPALAALTALAIHFMRPARDEDDLYLIGNPVSSRSRTGEPGTVLGRPLIESVRILSQINLFRLLTGIGSLPPKDARPVLARLRDSDDAQLQLFAQGGLNDAVEASEAHLRTLSRRARSHPEENQTHCAIAEINLYLLENNLIEEEDRPATWSAASHAIGDALRAAPDDALSLTICARLNLIGGEPGKAELAANSLAKIPGHEEAAQLILAEAAFECGDIDTIGKKLEGVSPGSPDRDDILDFWRKPKPAAHA